MTNPSDGEPAAAAEAQRILHMVRDLALELHPHLGHSLAVTLKSDLDRDLAFDSLGRAELLLRVERAFGVRLPETLIRDAATPGDLLAAALAAAPSAAPSAPGEATALSALPGAAAPDAAKTLVEALSWHVREHPDRPHILLWRSNGPLLPVTYGDLDAAARRAAQGLIEWGLLPGERVAIMLPTSEAFFQAFFGVLYASGVPVPIYPPFRRAQMEEHLRRQAGVLRNAEAVLLITNDEILPAGKLLYGLASSLRSVETIDSLSPPEPFAGALPGDSQAIALIQYTSGSTGDPKGVTLTHANLLANIRAMGQALDASSSDVFVSWLPLYHDMGLIGAWLGSLYFGAPAIIMPPLAFLADPTRWLRTISDNKATLSAAPNFAYELCLKSVRDEDIQGLDLSSLRMTLNGAEPVSPSTVRRFIERFSAYGLRPDALAPVFGLAENSVGLAFPPLGRAPVIDRIDREEFSRHGIATPTRPNGRATIEFVACGRPIPGHEARVVDERDHELPERHEGRLQFRGPSSTQGYFRNDEKNVALFNSPKREPGQWLETGDRAYIAGGDLYLTGRIKDIIIRAGRNIYPQELEELVGGLKGVRKGCVVAFASEDLRVGSERLVVMAETRLRDPQAQEELRRAISETCANVLDQAPDEIALVPPGAIPKTSSGKLRRAESRKLYESGAAGAEGRSLQLQIARLWLSGFWKRFRRVSRTAAEFAFAGWWWAALLLIAIPVWLLVLALPKRTLRHAAVRFGSRLFLWLTGARLSVETETTPPESGVVMVVNHASYLDAPALCAAIPGPLSFVAKSELAEQAVAGLFLRRLGTQFAHRFDPREGVEDAKAQLEAARAGERIVSMPEGTLTRAPGLLSFHLGPFVLAAEAGVPVVPITIAGTRSVLRGDQWFPHRGRIRVHIGAPITPEGAGFEAAVRLRDAARASVLARCGEPDLAHETPLSRMRDAMDKAKG
jgi:1-acyl-sn-glycerol-3-phosphate acyltransferase